MTALLEIREQIKIVFSSYDKYFLMAARFVLALVALLLIRGSVGSGKVFEGTLILVLIALLCGVLGNNITVLLCGLFLSAELFYLSMFLGAAMFLLLVVFFCLYLAIAPEEGIILLLAAVCSGIGLPFLIPVVAGLSRKVNSAVSVALGVLTYYVTKTMAAAAIIAQEDDSSPITVTLTRLAANKELILMLALSVVTVCAVYFIRRMSIDYAWYIAILFGLVLQLLGVIFGNFALTLHMSLLAIFLGFAISAIICVILQFFVLDLDYKRVERVQFEDAEYYYYVKAVPKVSVAPKQKQEKVINSTKKK